MPGRRTRRSQRAERTKLIFESLEDRRVLSTTQLIGEPVVTEPVVQATAALLTTEEWVRSLSFTHFSLIAPDQVQYLTPQQVASIPSDGYFATMSAAARGALSMAQVRALNIAAVRINLLTPTQISWLTAPQVQAVRPYDFFRLPASQIPSLTPAQLASINDPWTLSALSPSARAALTAPQVQALRVGVTRINTLTPQQIGWLSTAQIQSLKYYDFSRLNPGQTAALTPAQIATINDSWTLTTFSAASRAALTAPQVQALKVGVTRINQLTPQQTSWLTTAQIQSLKYYDFSFLSPSQIPSLTPAQVATINDSWTLTTFTPAARAALTPVQVQALQVAVTRINQLTPPQVSALTAAQVRSLGRFDFQYLTPDKVPFLTANQVASIPDRGLLIQWSPAARAALTAAQIQSLNVASVHLDLLTSQQVGYLTQAQVRSLSVFDLKYLNPNQIHLVTAGQIAAIPDPGPFIEWTAAARAALTYPQIQALNVRDVHINLLTAQQVGWLTDDQIRSLSVLDLRYLHPWQVPTISISQMALIPDPAVFSEWSPAARAALTRVQINMLNVASVRLNLLDAEQISWLTVSQIQSLNIWDIPLLAPHQIPSVSPQQFAQMPNATIISNFSDAVQAKLTREQLLALPFNVLSTFMRVEPSQMPPIDYVPAVDVPIGLDGIQGGMHMDAEAAGFFRLVPYSTVTHATIRSGNWSDPAIWRDGVVPGAGSRVLISSGTTVRFDAYMNAAAKTVRVDGTLSFATNVNTQLKVDTLVVFTTGKLHIGTGASPVQDNVTARILIADNGRIDTAWDPYLWSRGIVSRGEVIIVGKTVTPYVELEADPQAGDTTLYLREQPIGWKVGDELTIAGVDQYADDFGTDRVRIRAINGKVVTVDPLRYGHDAPDGHGLFIHAANMSRNVQFMAEDSSVVQERPHLAFVHNPDVAIYNLGVYGFGRTDKTKPINSPVVIGGVMQEGTGLNARARYALHFHHTGVGPNSGSATVNGSVVDGSPGWGYVNHSSKVNFERNVAFGAVGAGFVTEDGNEVGSMRHNLSMHSTGSGAFILSRRANHDFGHGGHGFWFQGPGVEVIGNIAAANGSGAFAYTTSSSKNLFDAVNLTDPALAAGNKAVPVGTVPLKPFEGNVAYASEKGLEIWFHQTLMTDGETLIKDFTSWNTVLFGIDLSYSGHVKVSQSKLIGTLKSYSGIGILSNRLTHDIVLDNLQVEGFEYGVYVPVRRSSLVNGGRYGNVVNFFIQKGHDTIRSATFVGSIQFDYLGASALRARTPSNYYMSGKFDFNDFEDRRIDSLFSEDSVRVATTGITPLLLQYFEQYGYHTPFLTATSQGQILNAFLNKTNYQLWQQYSVAFGGVPSQVDARILPGIYGFAAPQI